MRSQTATVLLICLGALARASWLGDLMVRGDSGGRIEKRQTAAPFPPLVYTTDFATGSVAPSLQTAAVTAGAPAQALLTSQGANTLTAMVPPFATTTTRENTIMPLATTGSFIYSSGTPAEVGTYPFTPYTATGTINLAQQTASSSTSRSAATSQISVNVQQWVGIAGSLILGLTTMGVVLL